MEFMDLFFNILTPPQGAPPRSKARSWMWCKLSEANVTASLSPKDWASSWKSWARYPRFLKGDEIKNSLNQPVWNSFCFRPGRFAVEFHPLHPFLCFSSSRFQSSSPRDECWLKLENPELWVNWVESLQSDERDTICNYDSWVTTSATSTLARIFHDYVVFFDGCTPKGHWFPEGTQMIIQIVK